MTHILKDVASPFKCSRLFKKIFMSALQICFFYCLLFEECLFRLAEAPELLSVGVNHVSA